MSDATLYRSKITAEFGPQDWDVPAAKLTLEENKLDHDDCFGLEHDLLNLLVARLTLGEGS